MPIEIELKLALVPAAKDLLPRHPAVRSVRRGRTRVTRVTSTYFDSHDSMLAEKGVALRVRHHGQRWVQQLKGPGDAPGSAGLSHRAEYEWPLTRAALDLTRIGATPWRKLVIKAMKHGPLVRCFTTDVERRTIPLRFTDGTLALLCLDLGEIRVTRDGRTDRVPISEVEIELESGDPANLFRLALSLVTDLPLSVLTASKSARGYALQSGERDLIGTPIRARSVALADDATTVEALDALIRECAQQIAANAPGLVADRDPEWIHQMRIGTRRLRSCLALVQKCAPSAAVDDLLIESKWLAGVLGTARDWDVFVRETLPPLAAWFAREEQTTAGLRRLRARAEARRRLARSAAKGAVSSPRFQHLLLQCGLLCATPRLGAAMAAGDESTPDTCATRADEFAVALLDRRQRKLDQRGLMLATGSPEDRHAVRIAAKRQRYIAEFFAPLFSRKRSKAYLKALAALQEVLGNLNDATTALRVANESGRAAGDAATGAVRGWVAAHAAALEPQVMSAWQRFADAKPFWIRN